MLKRLKGFAVRLAAFARATQASLLRARLPEATTIEADAETTLWCMAQIARHHRIDIQPAQIAHEMGVTTRTLSRADLTEAARACQLECSLKKLSWEEVGGLGETLPAIIFWKSGKAAILSGLRTDRGKQEIVVLDPSQTPVAFAFWDRAQYEEQSASAVLLVRRRFQLSDPEQPFSLRWFIPEILRQRRAVLEITLAVLALHALSLVVPLFFQIVIDKVLVHNGLATLVVLTVGVVAALSFEAVLNFVRGFLLLHASAKIDIRVTTRIFRHLMNLPLSYFEERPAGILLKNAQQDRAIREFLTGRLLQTGLDASGLVLFLPVLLIYSPVLTGVVLVFSAAIASFIYVMAGRFRKKLTQLYRAEAERQALLTEAIHGISTIKSLGMEPLQRRAWDDRSANAIERSIEVGGLATLARSSSQFIERLMSVAIIVIGIYLIFAGHLTVGALVAFQMLAGRVSGPLVQLASLIQDYQNAALSVRMLAEVMNAVPESHINRGLRMPVQGGVSFDDVTFTYGKGAIPALDHVSFSAPPGAFIGIVGRSGSGKSTLVKLIQGLVTAGSGLVRVDGVDINEFDKSHLRLAIGVVPQEGFLFRGTVRENIAAGHPSATMEQIIAAARMAGAEEFIQRMPKGFDTELQESATNLSGGQRQRIAIARAVLRNPRILIFDEATSALDPESEAIVHQQLTQIAQGRTVLMISHRLSSVRHAHRILVLEQGRAAGFDTHEQLLAGCLPYRGLWQRQAQAFQAVT